MTSKTTHIRIEKQTKKEYESLFPSMTFAESSKATLSLYKQMANVNRRILGSNLYEKIVKK